MGFFGPKIVKAIGTGAWKAGTKVLKVAGRTAGKGSYWVIKTAVVNPASKKVLNWGPVSKAGAMKALIKNGICPMCNKKFGSKGEDFCSAKCALRAAEEWNVYSKWVPPKDDSSDPMSLYFNCGCNKKSMTHSGDCKETPFMEI